MEKTQALAEAHYSRKQSGEDMDVSLLFKGPDIKKETAIQLVDGLMAGLSATILIELKAESVDQVEMERFKSGWESILKGLRGHFSIQAHLKKQAEIEGWIGTQVADYETLLLSQACLSELEYQGTQLWTKTDTQIAFKMPFEGEKSILTLEGTRNGLKESLLYLWFFVLIEELGIDNELELFPLIEKVVQTEINQVERYPGNAEYFESSLQPWMKALEKLN